MIPKANLFIAAAMVVADYGVVSAVPLAETMLDQYVVNAVSIVAVNDAGQCLMIVEVPSGAEGTFESRVVGDSGGAAKLYAGLAATAGAVKNIKGTPDISFYRKDKISSVGDPVAMLKYLHKGYVKERDSSAVVLAKHGKAISVAIGLGWPEYADGTSEKKEYKELVNKRASITEVNVNAESKLVQYGTLLTNAGINPLTYLPIVA